MYAGWTLWLAGCSICCRSNRYERGDNVDIPPKFIIFRRVFPLCAKAFNFCRRFRSHLSSGSLSLSLSVYRLVWLSFAATLWWICHSCLVLLLLPMLLLLLPVASSRRAFPLRLLPCALSVFKICHDHYHNWSCFVMAPPLCLPSFIQLYLALLLLLHLQLLFWFFAMIFCGSFESRIARNACLPPRLGQPFGPGPGLGVFFCPWFHFDLRHTKLFAHDKSVS